MAHLKPDLRAAETIIRELGREGVGPPAIGDDDLRECLRALQAAAPLRELVEALTPMMGHLAYHAHKDMDRENRAQFARLREALATARRDVA